MEGLRLRAPMRVVRLRSRARREWEKPLVAAVVPAGGRGGAEGMRRAIREGRECGERRPGMTGFTGAPWARERSEAVRKPIAEAAREWDARPTRVESVARNEADAAERRPGGEQGWAGGALGMTKGRVEAAPMRRLRTQKRGGPTEAGRVRLLHPAAPRPVRRVGAVARQQGGQGSYAARVDAVRAREVLEPPGGLQYALRQRVQRWEWEDGEAGPTGTPVPGRRGRQGILEPWEVTLRRERLELAR